jgi:hypothetical protein
MPHKYRSISAEDIREAPPNVLTRQAYDAAELSKWACEYIECFDSFGVVDRQCRVRERLRSKEFDKYWIEDWQTTERVAQDYFAAWDDLYFFSFSFLLSFFLSFFSFFFFGGLAGTVSIKKREFSGRHWAETTNFYRESTGELVPSKIVLMPEYCW